MPKLHLKPNRDRSVRRFHPWIFSGSLNRLEGAVAPGVIVDVLAADGSYLGRGFYNPHSQIICRMLTWRDEPIDAAFFERKIDDAYRLRFGLFGIREKRKTNAFRVVNAEGDGLPGLIVDQYAGFVAIQISTLGMRRFQQEIVLALQKILQPEGIFERSAGAVLLEEGMQPVTQVLAGAEPPPIIHIRENDLLFAVDLHRGQKTGFFLDQRENRVWAARMGRGRTVLNAFGYTGAFSVYTAKAGAQRVVTVDSSASAMELAKQNFFLNKLEVAPEDFVVADVFHYLRATTDRFDFIILDPPAFAHRQKEVENAARAYKDINLQAMRIVAPGGLLLTCSCSQPVSPDLFQKILFAAATDAGRFVRILGQSGHAPDHPVSVCHPEGRYLQAVLLYVE
ncbi:MAG: class I SAM-dependent rRNA methyltransferase [candidate division KSB1 bacterium]|nr:class I SAM-dependent rRNA methyltransferase [candidate division KSB1 bacterium]MDZ7301105.1 class I SAM-dependent rRNA methyltransferase [candidate division KSB1 bacterium]MDZ7312010.1 class I SAM-dependent rRNA methyltransferase [candidate division KSB1 bacterium]